MQGPPAHASAPPPPQSAVRGAMHWGEPTDYVWTFLAIIACTGASRLLVHYMALGNVALF